MTRSRDNRSENFSKLRQQAEERVTQEVRKIVTLSPQETQRLVHDLSVHQVELELQNEDLRNTQIELEASRRKYFDLYEFSPVGLFVLGQDGSIYEPNLTFSRMLGISRQKLVKQDLTIFIDSASQDRYHFFVQRLRTEPSHPIQCEVVLRPPNQGPITVRLEGIVLTQANSQTAYRLAISDITAQKQLEAKSQELAIERQRIKVLTDFVRNLSHYIRTPLTAIVTGLYLLAKQPDPKSQLEKIQEINDRVFKLNNVLDQLQHMAVLDNLVMLERPHEDLNALIKEVVQAVKPQADAKQIRLITRLQDNICKVPFDLMQMDRLLRNLLDNALRFTDSGGTIVLITTQEDDQIILTISDTGIGMDQDTIPHIFKRFYKATGPHQRGTSGAGLGLSMVQRIVELHYGTIEVNSIPGVNTVFTIKLPLN
jgi:PAS domain S-box-containing protein